MTKVDTSIHSNLYVTSIYGNGYRNIYNRDLGSVALFLQRLPFVLYTMLDQIKSLLKQGKRPVGNTTDADAQAETTSSTKYQEHKETDAGLQRYPYQHHLDDATHKLAETVPKQQHMTNNEKAARMVEQEKLQRNTMPVYPGLERFQLLEKMGE